MKGSSHGLVAAGLIAACLLAAGGAVLLWSSGTADERFSVAVEGVEGPITAHEAMSAFSRERLGLPGATVEFEAKLATIEAAFPAGSPLVHKVAALNRFALHHPSSSSNALVQVSLDRLVRRLDAEDSRATRHARQEASKGIVLAVSLVVAGLAGLILLSVLGTGLIARLIERVRLGAELLGGAVLELRLATDGAASATAQQSSAVVETSVTIEQLASAATAIAQNARSSSTSVAETAATMVDLEQAVEAIEQRTVGLGERSQRIGEILELITDFAGQTNLLALSAAIEAARAGVAGKGFSVVAAEVRKLAERSAESTQSIREIVAGIRSETDATIVATGTGARRAREARELMTQTAALLESSMVATREQKAAADQVAGAMSGIREATWQLSADQDRSIEVAERVGALANELDGLLAGFGIRAPGRSAEAAVHA
jgi:methyl-accepting chemotaxis protein